MFHVPMRTGGTWPVGTRKRDHSLNPSRLWPPGSKASGNPSLAQDGAPGTAKGLPQPGRGRHKDVGLSRLDLLKGADVEVRHLGQLLLRQLPAHALPPQVAPEFAELARDFC